MKWGSFGYIVFHKDGGTLIDKCFHAFCVSLKGGQIQGSAPFLVPDVQVHQRLQKDFQGLVVSVVGLQRRDQWLKTPSCWIPPQSSQGAESLWSQMETTKGTSERQWDQGLRELTRGAGLTDYNAQMSQLYVTS